MKENYIYTNQTIVKEFEVKKVKAIINVVNLEVSYTDKDYFVAKLVDGEGNSISNTKLPILIDNKTYSLTTSAAGEVKLSTVKFALDSYIVSVTLKENAKYLSTTSLAKMKINKATPVIVSSKHTFDIKSRKYLTVRLKDNLGKEMKIIRVTVMVNGVIHSARTDNRGYVDFLVNLNKKGTYRATFTYYGNDFYKSVSKSITVSVK